MTARGLFVRPQEGKMTAGGFFAQPREGKVTARGLSRIGDASLLVSVALGLYSAVDIWRLRAALPPDVCPVDINRPRLYVALGLAVVSLILSWWPSRGRSSAGGPSPDRDGGESDATQV